MNDIEIFKKLKKNYNTLKKDYNAGHYSVYEMQFEDFEAIENLIQRNKDLEQIEKEHKKENGRLRDKIKELEKVILLDSKPIILGMIPISRIKEKIEELTKIKGDLATYIATSERIKVLQELLEESDK